MSFLSKHKYLCLVEVIIEMSCVDGIQSCTDERHNILKHSNSKQMSSLIIDCLASIEFNPAQQEDIQNTPKFDLETDIVPYLYK